MEGLTVQYGPIRAIQDVSLHVDEGEVVALLGANGAGKSSLLSAVMGMAPITSGQVTFESDDITGAQPEDTVRLGLTMTPQGRQIFGHLTVEENLRIGGAAQPDREGTAATRIQMLELFPVISDRLGDLAGTLSGGQQQQLSIARALMSGPKMLMLDEPSLGLAPMVVDTIFEFIAELPNRGVTVLLVEQNATRAIEVASRLYVLKTGRLDFTGMPSSLTDENRLVRGYLGVPADGSGSEPR